MKTLSLVPGTPEWHAHRAEHFNASDAPAMLGCSSYRSRSALLESMATGRVEEIDPGTQRRFDDGHLFESWARPLAEQIIGDDLSPVVGSRSRLSASFDGINFFGDTTWEHKTLNDTLRQAMHEGCNGADLPKQYRVQMEQGFMVSGAERCLFMASKWDKETGELIEERHCWYEPDPVLAREIADGWKQFAEDLANYEHKEAKPEVVAAPQDALPALSVQVSGNLAIVDNLDVFGAALTTFVDQLNLAPKTDQHFADLEAATKTLKKAEDALTSEEERALSQAEGIEALRRVVGQYRELARTTRLRAEKVVKAEKENRRNEIRMAALEAFRAHVEQINATFSGRVRLPEIAIDITGVMKGKRTISSLEDAADTEVARAKIEANRVADLIRINIESLNELAKDHRFLFSDDQELVLKSNGDLVDLIKSRIITHEAEEKRKLEAERERIRREEQEKARVEAAKQAEPMPEKPIHQATDLHRPHGSNAHPAAAAELAPASRPRVTNTRPSDRQIIGTLMHAYGADRATVIEWIACMDLEEVA